MVKPLSQRKRLTLLAIAIIVFFIFLPVVILYSSGYRFGENWEIVKTGAILIDAPQSGASIYISDELTGESSYFSSKFFIQNLTPKKYSITVSKEGYNTWKKNVIVKEQMISRVESLLLPIKPKFTEIYKYESQLALLNNSATSSATSSNGKIASITNSKKVVDKNTEKESILKEYQIVSGLFSTTTSINSATPLSTSTQNFYKVKNDIAIWSNETAIYANWLGSESNLPEYLCDDFSCVKKNIVLHSDSIKNFDFLPGREDVLIYSDKGGVNVIEIDRRSPQNLIRISEAGTDFRIGTSGEVYILRGDKYYSVDLAS